MMTEINALLAEKVKLQGDTKQLIETMEKKDGIKLKNILRIQKTFNEVVASSKNTDTKNEFSDTGSAKDPNAIRLSKMTGTSEMKQLEWAMR